MALPPLVAAVGPVAPPLVAVDLALAVVPAEDGAEGIVAAVEADAAATGSVRTASRMTSARR
jgi:hypothetical protein